MAVVGLTKALAVDEAKFGVRVNSVAPSCTITTLFEETIQEHPEDVRESLRKAAAETQLLGRPCTTEDIGLACLYLAADGVFVTGVDLPVTGGAELDVSYKTRLDSDEVLRFMHLKKKKDN